MDRYLYDVQVVRKLPSQGKSVTYEQLKIFKE
jgi:hypothetical protein